MTADQNLVAGAAGVGQNPDGSPNNVPLTWRNVRVRGRQIIAGLVKTSWGALVPFSWPNPNSPTTTSEYDYMAGTAEQVASRFVDPVGNVVNFFTTWVVDWLWKLDGCPTPLTSQRLAQYLRLANQLNPWPQGYAGINAAQFPGELIKPYPAWPPTSGNTDLNQFLPSTTNPNGTNAAGVIG